MNYGGRSAGFQEENPYAVPSQLTPLRRGNYEGGSAVGQDQGPSGVGARKVGQSSYATGDLQSGSRGATQALGSEQVSPVKEGFKAFSDAQDAMTGELDAGAQAMGNLGSQGLKAQSDFMDSFVGQQAWLTQEKARMKEYEKARDSQKKKGGGLLGAIGGIAGSLIGGPVGGIIGGAARLLG
jgi:hypothetical protein